MLLSMTSRDVWPVHILYKHQLISGGIYSAVISEESDPKVDVLKASL